MPDSVPSSLFHRLSKFKGNITKKTLNKSCFWCKVRMFAKLENAQRYIIIKLQFIIYLVWHKHVISKGSSLNFFSNIKQISELINFYFPWNHHKTVGLRKVIPAAINCFPNEIQHWTNPLMPGGNKKVTHI